MRVSVFGVGYVGVVASGCFADAGHDVVAVDISPTKLDLIGRGHSPVVEAGVDALIGAAVAAGRLTTETDGAAAVARTDISFICVGTPSGPGGLANLAAIDAVADEIGRGIRAKGAPHVVVMRSTVPPGTAEDRVIPAIERAAGTRHGEGFTYYSNPEFLREGTAIADFHNPPMTLIGAAEGDDAAVPRALYAGLPAALHVVPYRVAESVKYLSNAYHAVKLAFANEGGQILAAHGVDARAAFRLFCEDRQLNISPAYLKPGFAFGGSCLPKDMRSLVALARARDVPAPFLEHVMASNEALIDRVAAQIFACGRKPVALLGLAFKRGTDDLRESPYVVLAERLIGRGYEVAIYDRHVETARLTGANAAFIQREIPHLARILKPDLAGALAGSGIVVVGHLPEEDEAVLARSLGDQVVFDLHGLPALRQVAAIDYRGICW